MTRILLFFLIALSIFFRTYNFSEFFAYDHEQDLQAWIVKDILIDKHPRLIGQETSITGVFVGPLYYYLLVPLFALFNFEPLSSTLLTTAVSIATLLSIYYVFLNLFDKKTALIGSFLYAVSYPIAFLDRWAVPTQLTLLWIVWYLFTLVSFLRGNYKTFPILIVLISLIWHIHIAFIPLLTLVPLALILSRKKILEINKFSSKKNLFLATIMAILFFTPLILFEARHNFSQTQSLFKAVYEEKGAVSGISRAQVVLENTSQSLLGSIVAEQNIKFLYPPIGLIIFLLILFILLGNKKFSVKEFSLIVSWIFVVFLSQYFSKRPITEYYFNNLLILSILIFAKLASFIHQKRSLRVFIYLFSIIIFSYSAYKLISYKTGLFQYPDRVGAVKFIASDVKKNNYSCIGINYIGDTWIRYGYRYLFWKNNVNLISPSNDIPTYSIVVPFTISKNEISQTFGGIGVILPTKKPINPKVCQDQNLKLQPLNGFVN